MTSRAQVLAACALATAACGGGTGGTHAPDAGRSPEAGVDVGAPLPEAAAESGADASTDTRVDEAASLDGTPTYTSSCTPLRSETGTAIDTIHGRLDGYLSFVVPIGGPYSCNGDNSHVHLQVRAGGSVYDVAVDTGMFDGDVNLYEADMPLPDGPWSEGWHGADALTYTSLGVHSGQFAPQNPSTLGAKLASELAGKNHVSVFGTGYSQENGCHDVHYHSGNGQDGALVIDPLSSPAHILFFRFSTDSF